jgi:hypothetical protein
MTTETVLDDYQQVVLSNATVTATGSAMVAMDFGHKELSLIVNITAVPTGTLPSITFSIQEVDPGNETTTIAPAKSGAAITGVSTQIITLPVMYGGSVLVSWTVTGTTPSFTGVFATTVNKGPSPAIYDQAGNGPVAVKPAGTGALASDPALVVIQSPNLPTTLTLSKAIVNASTTGNNTLIAGVASETVRVYKMALTFSVGGTATFQDGPSTALTGALTFYYGGSIVLDLDVTNPWFVTSSSNGFVVSLANGASVQGVVYYTQS